MTEPTAQAADAAEDVCPHCGHEVGDAWLVCAFCGKQIAAAAELEVGAGLADDRYQVLGVIGRGGFGITYEVGDRRLQRRVAVKELFPDSAVRHGSLVLTPPQGRPGFRAARDRFLREARVLARFTHPGIVRVYEVFEEHGTAYLVMELLDGRTLVDLLRDRGAPFSEVEVLDVAGRVAAALRPVHAAGVLHRDVNPSNVMMTAHGRIVVIDFGLARDYDEGQTVGMTRVVTPGYAPLEQYRGEGRFGPSTDVYGLSATLYRLATGRVPVSAVERDAGAALPSVRRLNPGVSKAVSDAIGDGLELEPGHRPQDLDSLLARLGVARLPSGPRSILLDAVASTSGDAPPAPWRPGPSPEGAAAAHGEPDDAPPGKADDRTEPPTAATAIVARPGAPAAPVAAAAARAAHVPGTPIVSTDRVRHVRPLRGAPDADATSATELVAPAARPADTDATRPAARPADPDATRPAAGTPSPVALDRTRPAGGLPAPVGDRTVTGRPPPGGLPGPGTTVVAGSTAHVPAPPPPPFLSRGPMTAAAGIPGSDLRHPIAVGPHRPGRPKITIPLFVLAVAIGMAAPVLATALLVFLVLPTLATFGDSAAHRLRNEHGVAGGWAERRLSPGTMAPARYARNLVMAVFRASPIIGIGAVLLAAWYALARTSISTTALDLVLRGIGGATVAAIVLTAREGSSRFRTGLGLDELVRRAVPDGRTTERVVVAWLVVALVVAGALWLAPDAFPLPAP